MVSEMRSFMYVWKNNQIRRQYDLEKVAAKNNGISPFTKEELAELSVKSSVFGQVHDAKTKRLIELAFVLGTLNGLKKADESLTESSNSNSSAKKEPAKVPPAQEKLYCLACKVKKQDKLVYTVLSLKATSEQEAKSSAVTECSMKNQTLLRCEVIKTYEKESMQFQFGIGKKELDSLACLGKKLL